MPPPDQAQSLHPSRFLIAVCCGLGFASYVSSYMRIPVVPLFAQDLGAGAVTVGFINSAFLLTTGVCAFPLGILADRWGRKLVVTAGLLISLITSILLAVSVAPWQLMVIYLFFGLGLAAIGPTLMAYVADLSPPDQLGQSYGVYTLAIYSGMSLGPALGGWMAQLLGFRLLFVTAAVLVGLITWLAAVLLPGVKHTAGRPAAPAKKPGSWRQLLRNRPLLGCWLLTIGGCIGLGVFLTFSPLFARDQGISVGYIGLIFGFQAGANALSRVPFGRLSDRVRRRWIVAVVGSLALGASLVGFGQAHTLPQFLFAATAIGLSMGLSFTPVGALIAEVVPPDARGLAMGGYNTCIYLSMMLSSAVMGIVINRIGYAGSYALAGLVLALATGGFYLLIRDYSGTTQLVTKKP